MFGMCIYPVLSLIYQTNQKNQRYDKATINRKRNCKEFQSRI
jgi:hypothetical protein